ncbi:MAG: DUF6867 family protein [Hyphomicrobium sp.]|jgi:hypothetical protein
MLEGLLSLVGYETAGPNGVYVFLLVTILLGGGAAWRTGQAVAQSWSPGWPLIGYTGLLAAAVRFLSFALFGGPLLSLPSYVIDFAILLALSYLGHRAHRAHQMTLQYAWAFEPATPLSWRPRK